MHIIFKLRIGFMIVKRETWLNNTQRYRAHIYIYIHRDSIGIIGHILGQYWDNGKENGNYYIGLRLKV